MVRAWLKLLWNSAAVAAVAVAAQLGLADMLGIVRWQGSGATRATEWSALLTWIGFAYAVAVVAGAMVGRRAVIRPQRAETLGARVVATLLAALGATAAIALAYLASRDATAPARVDPPLVVAITAGAGVLVGIIISVVALTAPPFSAGVRTWIAIMWLLAIGCAVAGVASHEPYPAPRLGVLDAPSLLTPAGWNGPRLMIVVAAIVAVAVSGVARWVGSTWFGVSVAGFGGPAVVAAAYLVAGPGEGAGRSAQFDPYLSALLATVAGLIASVLIGMLGRRGAARKAKPTKAARATAKSTKDEDERRPLFGELVEPEPSSFGLYAAYMESSPEPVSTGRRSTDYPTNEQPMQTQPTYGGTYSGRLDEAPDPNPTGIGGLGPLLGQPGSSDAHDSWLRELGSQGRHSADWR